MARQPLVHEGVVGRQQVEHAAVLAHDALEQQLGLAAERLAQVVVEVREIVLIGDRGAQVPELQPLAGEVRDQRARRARSASMRRTCRSSTAGCRSWPRRGDVDQLVVGDAAPQEEREARGELEIVDGRGGRAGAGGVLLGAEDELGAGQDGAERALDAAVERCRPCGRRCRT